MGLFGPPDIEKMKAKRDVNGLIKALNYKKVSIWQGHYTVRYKAANALGDIRDVSAVDPLIVALRDGSKDVCRAATEALVKIGTAEALIAVLSDWNVRDTAESALVKIGAPAVGPLITTLKDNYSGNHFAAAGVLKQISDPRAIEPLIAALKDNDRDVREAVAGALVKIGKSAVQPLIAALKDSSSDVRKAAAGALGQIGDAHATEPLIASLKDSSSDVSKVVANALGQIGDARAAEPLIAVLKDNDRDVRKAAAGALGQIGNARAIESLIAALKEWDVRDVAADALVEIGPLAVEPLIDALKDANLRHVAADTLGKIGDVRAVEPLIAILKDSSVCVVAAGALGELKDPRAVEPLIAVLKNVSSDVRNAAADALERLRWRPGQDESGAIYWVIKLKWDKCIKIGVPAVGPLIAALKDSNSDVRDAAAGALVKIGAPAVEPLVVTLKDGSIDVRAAAAGALERLRWQPSQDEYGASYWAVTRKWDKCIEVGVPAVEPLIAAFKDGSIDVRAAAAGVLGKIGDPRAVELLIASLEDKDGWLRKAAAKSLVNLYQSRKLDKSYKDQILAQRNTITAEHNDDTSHTDNCYGSDYSHTDAGIDVDFPL